MMNILSSEQGLHRPIPDLFSPLVFFLLYCQLSLIAGSQKILSTTTHPSIEGLTTTKGSATEKVEFKNQVAEFVSFVVNVDKVKSLEQLLVNSNVTKKMEDALQQQLDILETVEKYYGFILQNDGIKECAYQYHKYKRYLIRECSVLLTECADAVDNVDVLHFQNLDEKEKLILHACSQRAVTIFGELTYLVDHIFQLSLTCAMDASIMVLNDMVNASFLGYIENSTELLLKEVDYLMDAYESHVKENNAEENYTESYSWKEMKLRKVELAEIRNLRASDGMKADIKNFTKESRELIHRYLETKNSHRKEKRGQQKATMEFTKDLKDFFDLHLRIVEIDNDYISNWTFTPGVYKVIRVNNRLKEIIGRSSMDYPKMKNPYSDAQLDITKAKLFTGVSTTFGKLCENSPSHLVGTCTSENHEICKHVSVNWGGDNDQEVLSNEELILIGSVEETKHCTCGFRTDCASSNIAKKKRSTCFLIPNSKGQCRGSAGYPCRSYPLEAGKYDETCVSGYCNSKRNACEQMSETGNKATSRVSLEMKRLAAILKKKLKDLIKLFI